MSTVRRIAKNNIALFVAQIINIIVSLVLVSFIARFLLPVGYGKYNLASSFSAVFVVFMDLGLSTLLIREISRKKEELKKYFNNILSIYLIFSVIIFALIFLSINLLNYPFDTALAICLLSLSFILGTFSVLVMSVFRAFEKMEYEAIATIFEKIVLGLLAIAALIFGYGLIGVCAVFLLSSMLKCLILFLFYGKKFYVPKLEFEPRLWKDFLRISFPFALVGIFTMLYLKIDTLMLSMIKGNEAVGIYNAAYNPVLFLSFIPSIFLTSIFPVLSNYFISSKKDLKKMYELSFKYLFIIILPIMIGIALLSEKIILFLFGQSYIGSIFPMKILALSQIFAFLAWLSGTSLNAINKQKLFMKATGLGLIANIFLNYLLISKFGIYGAAVAILVTQIIVFSLLLHFNLKNMGEMKLNISKPLFAVFIMGIVLSIFNEISLAVLIPLGASAYFIALYLIKGFSKEDKEIFSNIIKPKK